MKITLFFYTKMHMLKIIVLVFFEKRQHSVCYG